MHLLKRLSGFPFDDTRQRSPLMLATVDDQSDLRS